jgi:pilus assembly protein Flp/PilA
VTLCTRNLKPADGLNSRKRADYNRSPFRMDTPILFGPVNAFPKSPIHGTLSRTHCKEDDSMRQLLKRLWREEEGQDLVEYGLLLVLVALAATAGMTSLAGAINTTFINAGTNLSGAPT